MRSVLYQQSTLARLPPGAADDVGVVQQLLVMQLAQLLPGSNDQAGRQCAASA
jgi:hypothetical protein